MARAIGRFSLALAIIAIAVGVCTSAGWPAPAYPNGFPTDPRFFPLGVWMQAPIHAGEFKAIGINTFVGLWQGPTEEQLAELSKSGLYVAAEQNPAGLGSPHRGIIKAWTQQDEPDNAQPLLPGLGRFSSCVPAAEIARRSRAIKAHDPSRPVMLNFGRGVADTAWTGRGACTGDTTNYYPRAISGGDIISFDIYPIADYGGRLELVAQGLKNLKTWITLSGSSKTIWNAVEAVPISSGVIPTSAQMRAEVWMSLVSGSHGIIYFVHQFSPHGSRLIREDGIFNFPTLAAAVAAINSQITRLAPVLNSPTISPGVSVASFGGTPINTMVKRSNGSTYIFAVAIAKNRDTAMFSLPEARSGMVRVLDEKRELPLVGGVFRDRFDGYGVHLYEITGTGKNAPH